MAHNKEYAAFQNANYPEIYPCVDCTYWRSLGDGVCFSERRNSRYYDYACHYGIKNNTPRGENTVYTTGECAYFEGRRNEN